jgi:hypothetical protein
MYTAKQPGKFNHLLSPKGSCWYCNHQLDDVRRFCNKICAEAFEEDEMAMERRLLAMAGSREPAMA